MKPIERITKQSYIIECEYQADDTSSEDEDFAFEDNMLIVRVKMNNEVVGEADFSVSNTSFHCNNISVKEGHRRKGIANAIYVSAEQYIKRKLENSWDNTTTQSKEAQALWANPNRPFGQH